MPHDLVCVIDDDAEVRGSLDSLLRATGLAVRTFASPSEFMACELAETASCLILDVRLQGADGLDFQQELVENDARLPIILISGHGDIPMTVRGMRAGALTFLPKPFEEEEMLSAVAEAIERARRMRAATEEVNDVRMRYEGLTPREREILGLVSAGLMNKQIAGRLELSEITVKIHRGNLMRKMRAQSLADLVRMAEALGVRQADVSRFASART
jgi:FixJ family two-component response regulator